jgi:hypothetical protein
VASILIWRGLAASFLGSETLSTPFLNEAAIFSVSKAVGHGEAAREVAVAALDAVIALAATVLLFELALAGDGERLVLDADIDVLEIDIRQIGFHHQLVFGFIDVHGGRPGPVGLGLVEHAGESVLEEADIG